MNLVVFITIIIVSLDASFFGFLYGFKNKAFTFLELLVIGLIPCIICYFAIYFGSFLSIYLNSLVSKYINFFIFFYLSITSLKDNNKAYNINFKTIILIGLYISIDSSISSISLSIDGYNNLFIPIYFGLFHSIVIYISNRLVLNKKIFNTSYIKYFNSLLFFILAVMKIF